MLLYDPADSVFKIDPGNIEPAREFKANPSGPHSETLRRILHRMRTGPLAGKHILIVKTPFKEWMLAQLTGNRGEPPVVHHNRVFTSLADAEWEVFKMRWEALSNKALPDDI